MSALAWVSGFVTCYALMSDKEVWMIVGFITTIIFSLLDYSFRTAIEERDEKNDSVK